MGMLLSFRHILLEKKP
ncbi:hypothetical protein CGLO_12704 [Colletotrichum gloeosporioides Cg-14]|uniref:Uncharacterized protein n=1 Tax=Colletotrichum gloeosporioides (strain Cg-14) TaxID=1237896 RepID=T0L8X7_COLGC|nr:hypothetical protein CGLO_12704 [Colletotrichum gloeosporioides Cg-14]